MGGWLNRWLIHIPRFFKLNKMDSYGIFLPCGSGFTLWLLKVTLDVSLHVVRKKEI